MIYILRWTCSYCNCYQHRKLAWHSKFKFRPRSLCSLLLKYPGRGINLFLLPSRVGNQSRKKITLNSKPVAHWVGSSTSYLLWKLQLSETVALYSTGQSVWVTISAHTEVIYIKIKLFHHLLKVYIVSKQNKNYLDFLLSNR